MNTKEKKVIKRRKKRNALLKNNHEITFTNIKDEKNYLNKTDNSVQVIVSSRKNAYKVLQQQERSEIDGAIYTLNRLAAGTLPPSKENGQHKKELIMAK